MYENFYHLKNSPFRLSPDPSFYFGSKGHNRALAYLRYGLQQREGFIVVTGTPGTGKTTLSRALLQEIGREKVIVAELNTTHLEADDVLRMVAASFGLEFENEPKATILKRLETFFISRYRAGYHLLLIIDEAQNLPFGSLEELRMLSNFYLEKNALIQIFLLGQDQFREHLYSEDLEQLRQRVVASCHLEPLNQEETRSYIEHRLNIVGWKNDPRITDRAFARIYTLTKGVPRRINTFCDRLFLFGSLDDLHQFKDEEIKAVAKELMYEVSAKNVKLSDIDAQGTEGGEAPVDLDTLDSEQLRSFSDDVPEEVALESDVVSEQIEIEDPEENKESAKPSEEKDSVGVTPQPDRQTLRVVTSNNTAVEAFEEDAEPFIAEPMAEPEKPVIDTQPEWWKLVALAVDYYQNPESHDNIGNTSNPLHTGISGMLKVAVGKKIIPPHMRVENLSGLSDETIQAACINYVKNVLLTSKADYYRRLGVKANASLEHIRSHYRYLFRLLQIEQEYEVDAQDEMFIRRLNKAFSTLRSPEKREEYDEFLRTPQTAKAPEKPPSKKPSLDFDEDELADLGIDPAYSESDRKEQKVSLKVYLLVIILCLIAAGTAGVYYFKPDLAQIKAKLGLNLPQIKSIENENTNEELVTDKISEIETIPTPDLTSDIQSIPSVKPEQLIEKPAIKPILDSSKNDNKKSNTTKKVAAIAKPVAKPVIKPVAAVSKPKPAPKQQAKPIKKATKTKVVKPKVPVVPKADALPAEVALFTEDSTATANKDAKTTTVKQISDKALTRLISDFSLAYEEGELDEFMALFSKDALTNNDEKWDSIYRDYESLFNTTEMRVIDLQGVRWEKTGTTATGDGDFVVTVLRHGGENVRKFAGKIILEVRQDNNKLLIKGMYHAYEEDEG